MLNVFLTLMIVWGVIDSITFRFSVSWLYFTMFIFLMFVLGVRGDVKEKYLKDNKLFRQGLM
jgi:hypothetical protein